MRELYGAGFIPVSPEVQHCYGQCHVMQRTFYCTGHIRRGDLGHQLCYQRGPPTPQAQESTLHKDDCCMTVRNPIQSAFTNPADTLQLQHSWGCFNCLCTLAATRSSLSKLGHAFIPQCCSPLSSRCLAVIS